jgi:diguanylate cyclase (GGDEF)-like protein
MTPPPHTSTRKNNRRRADQMDIIGFLYARSKAFIITTGLVLVAALGLLDYLSGPDVSFLVFHALPVFLATWFVGRRAGLWMCGASGLTWVVVAELSAEHFSTRAVPYWNASVKLSFMLALAFVVAALKRAHEKEREMARTDYLTGAINFRHFSQLAALELSRAERHARPLTVVFMDIDDFKLVNDRRGHSAGDELLRAAAATITAGVRSIDVVARLGGDEFAILMPETDARAAEVAVRRVRRDLLALSRDGGWPVTYSIGVVTWDEPPASVDEMLRAADALMYAAKHGGKNLIQHGAPRADADAA